MTRLRARTKLSSTPSGAPPHSAGSGVLRLVARQQRDLSHCEQESQRHHSPHFERDPEIGRKIAPDHFVENGEDEKEDRPAQRELSPALGGQVEGGLEHDSQQRLAEKKSNQQRRTKQRIDDGRLDLDEMIVLQIQREP